MKHVLAVIFLAFIIIQLPAQDEKVFAVKKHDQKVNYDNRRLFDLNITPGIDSLCCGIIFGADFSRIFSFYDSISAFNIQINITQTYRAVLRTPQKRCNGYAILKFYKKQPNQDYDLVYVKSWKLYCREH